MSETSSTALLVGGGGGEVGYGGYKTPFTAMQWQELEHQAKIYKYMVAGLPVPPDLVVPIRRSLEALSARFFSYPSLGYCSYYGKKFDPEPGRCRRTDGKKWRCSKDAHPDSKYCERHMHRGRNRSRKPVESSSSSSASQQQSNPPPPLQPSLSATMPPILVSNSASNNNASGSFQNLPLYTFAGSQQGPSFGSSKLQMERAVAYDMDGNPSSKEIRYVQGLNPNHRFSSEASRSFGGLGLGSTNMGTWRPAPSQVGGSTNDFLKHGPNEPMLLAVQENTAHHGFEQQHISTSTNATTTTAKQQQQPIHPFFSEWPATKESWSGLDADDDGSNKNVFSSTRLSISIPRSLSDSSQSHNEG